MHIVLVEAKVALKVTVHLFLYGSSAKSRQDLRMLYILTVVCDVLQFDFVTVFFSSACCYLSLNIYRWSRCISLNIKFVPTRLI